MTDSETHVLSIRDLPSNQHTVDNERIAELESRVSMLRDALIGMASLTPCDQSPHQHHYRMPSGLCVCQGHSWAR